MTLKGLGGYYKNIPELKFCTLCKKNRMACTFYWHGKKHMCMYCHQQFTKGRKLVDGKWRGERLAPKEKVKRERLYSSLTKEERERLSLITDNNVWLEDYLPD